MEEGIARLNFVNTDQIVQVLGELWYISAYGSSHIDVKSRLRRRQLASTGRIQQRCRPSELYFQELLSWISRELPLYGYRSFSAPRPLTQTCKFKINVPTIFYLLFYLLSRLFPQTFVVVGKDQDAISSALEKGIDMEEIPTKYQKKKGS